MCASARVLEKSGRMVLAQMACRVTQNLHVFSGSDKKAPMARTAQLAVAQCISSCSAGTPRHAWTTPAGLCRGGQLWCGGNSRALDARSTSRWSTVHLPKSEGNSKTESPLSPHSPAIVLFAVVISSPRGRRLCFASCNAEEAHCGPPLNFTGILNGALQALSPWEAERPAERSCRYRSCFSSVNPSRCSGGVSRTRAAIRSFTHQKHTSQLPGKSGMRFSASDSSINLAGNIYFKFHFHFLFLFLLRQP